MPESVDLPFPELFARPEWKTCDSGQCFLHPLLVARIIRRSRQNSEAPGAGQSEGPFLGLCRTD